MRRARASWMALAGWLPGAVAYFAILVLVRMPQLLGNLLFLDDYGLIAYPEHDLTTARFPLAFEMLLVEGLFPGFSLSGGSFCLAAAGLALAAEGIRRLARDLGISAPVAFSLPLPFAAHPCTNELVAWAVTRGAGLCLFSSVQGYRILRRARRPAEELGGGALLLAGGLGYEVSLLVPAAFLVGEIGLDPRRRESRPWVRPAAALLAVTVAMIAVKTAWRQLYPGADPRGPLTVAVDTAELRGRLKIASNMLSNVYQSPLAYYLGFERAGPAWKWLPATIPIIAIAARAGKDRGLCRAVRGALVTTAVLATPVLPALALERMYDSWRVSVPGTLAFSTALAVATQPWEGARSGRWTVAACLALAAALVVPPGRYYLDRRLRCNAIEESAVAAIERFWAQRGLSTPRFGIRVVPFPDQLPWDPAEDTRVVTEGFVPVTTSSLSAFKTSWFARQLLVHHHGFGLLDGQGMESPGLAGDRAALVRDRVGFVALTHDGERRLTKIQLAPPEDLRR